LAKLQLVKPCAFWGHSVVLCVLCPSFENIYRIQRPSRPASVFFMWCDGYEVTATVLNFSPWLRTDRQTAVDPSPLSTALIYPRRSSDNNLLDASCSHGNRPKPKGQMDRVWTLLIHNACKQHCTEKAAHYWIDGSEMQACYKRVRSLKLCTRRLMTGSV